MQQKFILLQFWRLEVWNQGVSRAMLLLKPVGKIFYSLSPSFCLLLAIDSWLVFLVYRCIVPISASITTRPPSPCVFLFFFLSLSFFLSFSLSLSLSLFLSFFEVPSLSSLNETIIYLFIYFFGLRRVLVAACGIFCCGVRASLYLWCAGFLSLVVARGLQSPWAL